MTKEPLVTTELLRKVLTNSVVIIDGETNEKYHSHKEFISASRLKTIGQSPFHYSKYFDKPVDITGADEEKEATKSQQLGTVVHTLLLEPDSFESEFFVMPECDKRTTKGKEIYAEAVLECKGRTIVDALQLHKAKLMVAAALSNEVILKALDSGKPERSIYWIDDETGLPLKCRADFWRSNNNRWDTVVDLKTAKDGSPEGFPKAVIDSNYPLQAAMQVDGIKKATGFDTKHYIYVAIENKFPYATACYRIDLDDIENGRRQYRSYLQKVRECTDSGIWGGYETMVESAGGTIALQLPTWKKLYF